MKLIQSRMRIIFYLAVVVLVLGAAADIALAQTFSPSSLTFAVPTGTPGGVSAPQPVTLSITDGSVTFGTASATPPFAVVGSSCVGTITAPAQCQVSVTLTTTATTLQIGTLTIPNGVESSLTVPLSGAYGSIKLFDATTVQSSFQGAGFSTLYTIGSASLNLSCPVNPTAKLSNKPDGTGNVLVDNYVVLGINGTPVVTSLSSNGFSAVYDQFGNTSISAGKRLSR